MPVNLRQMVGPLPLGAWVGVVGAGVVAAVVINRRADAQAAADAGPSSVTLLDGSAQLPAAYDPSYAPGAGGTSSVAGTPTTADEWVSYATKLLVAQRKPYSSLVISQTLQKYVQGGYSFTTDEQTIINDAIRAAGLPPGGAPVIEPSTPGATGVVPGEEHTPPNLRSDLGQRRTTVRQVGTRAERTDELARRVYGSSVFSNYIRFFNAELYKPTSGYPNGRAYTDPLPLGIVIGY